MSIGTCEVKRSVRAIFFTKVDDCWVLKYQVLHNPAIHEAMRQLMICQTFPDGTNMWSFLENLILFWDYYTTRHLIHSRFKLLNCGCVPPFVPYYTWWMIAQLAYFHCFCAKFILVKSIQRHALNTFTHSLSPFSAATCRGVLPALFSLLIWCSQ